MLSVSVHKNIAEYQPKVVGKMTLRTTVSVGGAVGSSILAGLYIYFVLGLSVSDNVIIIYAISLPFWLCGFFRPKGMVFEQFFPLWVKAKLSDDRIFYTPSFYRSGVCETPKLKWNKKGKVYGKYYRKERSLKGIEAYSPRTRVIS